jgi:hypothetical protein
MRRRVPLTDADWDIWITRLGAHTLRCPLYEVSISQDRRDAEVMLQLATFDHWERDYTEDRTRRWPTAKRLVGKL